MLLLRSSVLGLPPDLGTCCLGRSMVSLPHPSVRPAPRPLWGLPHRPHHPPARPAAGSASSCLPSSPGHPMSLPSSETYHSSPLPQGKINSLAWGLSGPCHTSPSPLFIPSRSQSLSLADFQPFPLGLCPTACGPGRPFPAALLASDFPGEGPRSPPWLQAAPCEGPGPSSARRAPAAGVPWALLVV